MSPDPNPVYDSGAPKSFGCIEAATFLCEIFGIQLELQPPSSEYMHGWGQNGPDAQPVVASWEMTVFNIHGKPTLFDFYIISRHSPLIIGLP